MDQSDVYGEFRSIREELFSETSLDYSPLAALKLVVLAKEAKNSDERKALMRLLTQDARFDLLEWDDLFRFIQTETVADLREGAVTILEWRNAVLRFTEVPERYEAHKALRLFALMCNITSTAFRVIGDVPRTHPDSSVNVQKHFERVWDSFVLVRFFAAAMQDINNPITWYLSYIFKAPRRELVNSGKLLVETAIKFNVRYRPAGSIQVTYASQGPSAEDRRAAYYLIEDLRLMGYDRDES